MAVYTEVPDDALADFVARFDVGDILSCKGIAEGVENTNYLVVTTKRPLILTLYEKRVARADLPFFLGLMEHLSSKGISCPVPLRDKQGEILHELAGRPAAIVTFLDGLSLKRPQAAHCEALGRALGDLHVHGKSYVKHRPNDLSLTGWQRLAARLDADAERVTPGLRELIAAETAFLAHRWPGQLPSGIIHADLFPNNVFFLGDRLSGLIDFYFACNDFFAYDLAVCLNAWCFEPDAAFNVTKAAALLRGYRARRPFAPAEVEHLPLLARGAALRFLLTRAYDWLHTPEAALVKRLDPHEYIRKLRFHQAVSSAREYGIESAA